MWTKLVSMFSFKKVFITLAAVAVGTIGFLWWQNGSLQQSIGSLRSDKNQLTDALETTRNSVSTLEIQIRNLDEALIDRRARERQVRKEADSLRKALQNEIRQNEKLEECLTVPLSGDYNDSLYRLSGGEDGSEVPESP